MTRTLAILAALIASASATGPSWTAWFCGGDSLYDAGAAIGLDSSGNVFVAGEVRNDSSDYDFVTIKYDPEGLQLWARIYSHTSLLDDAPVALAVDPWGNGIVTGGSWANSYECDLATVKYRPDGETAWVRRYGAEGCSNPPSALALDRQGNAYVVGYSSFRLVRGCDMAIWKFDTSGNLLWRAVWDSTNRLQEFGRDIALSQSGDVFVAGGRGGPPGITACYDSEGREKWRTLAPGAQWQYVGADRAGGAYVFGGNGTFPIILLTQKYDTAGNVRWTRAYEGPWEQHPKGLAVDDSANVYVTAWSSGVRSGFDILTIKYDSAGYECWVQRYDGPWSRADTPTSIATDGKYVYVVGSSSDTLYNRYLCLVCYDAADGRELWVHHYAGPARTYAGGAAVVTDAEGSAYVVGFGYLYQYEYADILTQKYRADGLAVASPPPVAVTPTPLPTILRNVLVLPSAFSTLTSDFVLFDPSGRRVLDLSPGPNDISHLSPGVYFVREEGPRIQGSEGPSQKVVIQR